jgi:hypothetical protein
VVEGGREGGRVVEGRHGGGVGADGCGKMTGLRFGFRVHLKRRIATNIDNAINAHRYI